MSNNRFVITEQKCITDYILTYAPKVVISEERHINYKSPFQNENDAVSNKEDRVGNPVLSAIALGIGGVKDDCWKQRESVNQFYHNVLAHFTFIYLDANQSILEQINIIIGLILNDQTNYVVDQLKKYKNEIIENLEKNVTRLIVTNASNPNNLGGAVTYKRGTVEEAICRKSDLFLDMLFFHAKGCYQKNILLELMMVFKKMLQTGMLPINNRKESDELAEKWINLVYKTSHANYHIYPDHFHHHPEIFFIDKQYLPSLTDLKIPTTDMRELFFNSCKIATVIDIASPDLRTQTKALKFFGLQEDEKACSFEENMGLLTQIIEKLAENQNCTLAMIPLGCGAFGHAIESFWSSLIKNINELTRIANLSLVIREDNCFKLIKLAHASNINLDYKISWETTEKIWISCWNQRNIENTSLVSNFIKNQINSFPIDKVNIRCAKELNHAYLLRNSDEENFKKLISFCHNLLGDRFKLYQLLLCAVEKSINNYDQHTGIRGYFTNKTQGENHYLIQLRNLYESLYKNANFTEQGIYHYLGSIKQIIREKDVNCPDRSPPSLLDKSFQLLNEGIVKFEHELKKCFPSLYQTILMQRFFSRFAPVFPYNAVCKIANNLEDNDVKNLSITVKK